MADQADDSLVCHSYTHARKHPQVVGVIGGWVSPWPATPTQIAALVGTAVVLVLTRNIWGLVVPGFGRLFVMVAGPIFAAWAARHLRIQGRSPMRALSGGINYVCRARSGVVNGRPYRSGRAVAIQPVRVYVRDRRS